MPFEMASIVVAMEGVFTGGNIERKIQNMQTWKPFSQPYHTNRNSNFSAQKVREQSLKKEKTYIFRLATLAVFPVSAVIKFNSTRLFILYCGGSMGLVV